MNLDYNSFNVKITYHVDVEKNAGTISVDFYNSTFGTRHLEEVSRAAYNSSGIYPCTFTYESNVWVPDPPPGIYKIRAEYWSHKLVPGTANEYVPDKVLAVDEISITIAGDITTIPPTTALPTTIETTQAPKPDVSSIYVYSSPGDAEIWINGIHKVNTNFDSNSPFGFTDLTPGTYYVTLRKQGYVDYAETVNLNAKQIYDVRGILQQGITPTGWVVINSIPADANALINDKQITYISGIPLMNIPPGKYDISQKKDGYEDWTDTITVTGGQITEVNAELPLKGGVPVVPIVGGAAGVLVIGGGIGLLRMRGRGAAVATQDLYKEWWNSATPAQQKDWQSFDNFLNNRMGAPYLTTYQDTYSRPSWGSAYTSWQKEVTCGSKESFEDWVKRQYANQQMTDDMMARAVANKSRPQEIVEATDNYARFVQLTRMKQAVAGDKNLSDFVERAGDAITKDGIVDANKFSQLEHDVKSWIVRDKIIQDGPDYTYQDAVFDTSNSIIFRLGAAYLTGGYSEMVLNPISALGTMRNSIMQGDSNAWAVTKGFLQSGFEMALGETGRLFKNPGLAVEGASEAENLVKLSRVNKNLASELSTFNEMAQQGEEQITRDAFMKSSEVAKVGKTGSYELNDMEKRLLKLNNNPEFRQALSENSELIPDRLNEIMGTAKQKAYQNARNQAVADVMKQMEQDGINTADKSYFIKQTGTHAQPGNHGWNSLKSDFDHSVNFDDAKYNQLYEQRFDASLEAQGTTSKAIDANVYGKGTSSRGEYTGGAQKFVTHYNETSGSDIMVRNDKGVTTITRETPQSSTSLLSRMDADDVKTAQQNYQNFFKKDLAKAGGNIDNQIMNASKTVSRSSGQYSASYVENFQKTGTASYNPPSAAKVADLIKKQGYSVDDAIKKVGYGGSKQQLLLDFAQLLGVKL